MKNVMDVDMATGGLAVRDQVMFSVFPSGFSIRGSA